MKYLKVFIFLTLTILIRVGRFGFDSIFIRIELNSNYENCKIESNRIEVVTLIWFNLEVFMFDSILILI